MLLNTTSGEQTERFGPPNLTLRGFDFIDRIKSLLEAKCPGIVSCADVIALATRDSIVATVRTLFKQIRDNKVSKSFVLIKKRND